MAFDKLVKHLGKRGFVTRKMWKGRMFLYFGMDNILKSVTMISGFPYTGSYTLCLADILAKDWKIVKKFWDGGKDDFRPFGLSEMGPLHD